jgi:hypothetical protein
MKLHDSIKIKDTTSLFMDTYQYKVVLVCPAASWFRGNDLTFVADRIRNLEANTSPRITLKTPTDKKYCVDILNTLEQFDNYQLRIEHPIINCYTNNSLQVVKLTELDPTRVKYVSMPNKHYPNLNKGTIIVKTLDFDYKVYLGRTRKSFVEFVGWATNNKKIRLTNKAKEDLNCTNSWGGSYFYVKGDQTLTMVKMFIGSEISKIETIIKA